MENGGYSVYLYSPTGDDPMGKLLSLDNPFFQAMERVADFFILNILTIVCSIPLITAGAAFAAHYKVMQNLVMDSEQPIGKSYFRAFAQSFKQATALWLMTVLAAALIVVDVILTYLYLDGLAVTIYVLLGVIGVVAFGTAGYAFALIARYENSLKEHLRNSLILAVGNLPRTLLMLLVYAIPLLMALLSLPLFLNTLIIWATFGISIILYLQARIIKPVFLMLEKTEDNSEESL